MMERLVELDVSLLKESFARSSFAVAHSLVAHDSLKLEALARLADALPPSSIERNRGDLPLVQKGEVEQLQEPPSQTVLGIATNGAWMVMKNIEQSDEYKRVLDDCLDEVEPLVEANEGPMTKREGFIFLSAPGSVTPAHIDPEHNFLLQVRGVKNMSVGGFPDEDTAQMELERYMTGGHRNIDRLPADASVYEMHPGDGVYVAPFAPHLVQNGPEPSISLSITWRTRATERAAIVHRMNSRLRKFGLSPRMPGKSSSIDGLKAALPLALKRVRGSRGD